MRFKVLGDICVDKDIRINNGTLPGFHSVNIVLGNLEGPIVRGHHLQTSRSRKPIGLCNSEAVVKVLKKLSVTGVCLANNHMFDYKNTLINTKKFLKKANIESFGAGSTLREAAYPCIFAKGTDTLKAFSFGWDVIGCRPATSTTEGVNPLTPKHTLETIRQLRAVDNSSFVIFIMHWNYELELYPQPAHRQLAHDLIGEGVDAVIGLHPHVAQGAELVDGKPIIYSLGNWFFPVRQFGHIRLVFPPIASRELALELDVEGRQVNDICFHWYQFDADENKVRFEKTEKWGGSILKKLTPFDGMSHDNYIKWFKKNRVKRRGLPVYKNYHDESINRMKDGYVKLRQKFIELLLRLRVKGGPR